LIKKYQGNIYILTSTSICEIHIHIYHVTICCTHDLYPQHLRWFTRELSTSWFTEICY